MNYRPSKHRDRILEFLRASSDHPTADMIYTRLKNEFPDLSLGTVYRNLNILSETGVINKIDCGSTFDRFDGATKQHYHFICEKCGSVIDLDLPAQQDLNKKIANDTGLRVRDHEIRFFGICGKCNSA